MNINVLSIRSAVRVIYLLIMLKSLKGKSKQQQEAAGNGELLITASENEEFPG